MAFLKSPGIQKPPGIKLELSYLFNDDTDDYNAPDTLETEEKEVECVHIRIWSESLHISCLQ